MGMKVSRRQALALVAAGTAAACSPNTQEEPPVAEAVGSEPNADEKVFAHGVASGDPLADSVVIWTRIETKSSSETVVWELARDPQFETLIAKGDVETSGDLDFTVKAIPGDLEPGTTYYYRFKLGTAVSQVGRTKTLPKGAVEKLGIALASCSNFVFGYFNAYDAIAKDETIDVVLHTGDYIYEYGSSGWGAEMGKMLGRPHDPPHEIVSLEDYRLRHAQYKSDPASKAMHAAHPLIVCWDDHESTNNPWSGGAQNHQPETEGDWETRLADSLQAYYEWMPIREPGPGQTRKDLWRTYEFGDLATLITLETRHTARGEQVDYAQYYEQIQTQADRDAFMTDVIGDPARKMISEGMETEIREGLTQSLESGQPWRVFGNASPIARMLVPDILAHGVDPAQKTSGGVPGVGADIVWKGKWNLPFYTDTWDGYPAAREAFYDLCKDAGATDLLFLTGDSHSFWMNQLFDDEGTPMGLEVGTAGISSPGDFVESGWEAPTAEQLDRVFEKALDEVIWTDNMHQGYVRVELTKESGTATFIAVDTVLQPDYRATVLRTAPIVRSDNTIAYG